MNAMVSESTAQAKVTAKAAPYLSFIHVSYMFHTLSISWLEVCSIRRVKTGRYIERAQQMQYAQLKATSV